MNIGIRLFFIIGMVLVCVGCYDSGDFDTCGCDDASGQNGTSNNQNSGKSIALPPANAPFDYQLGDAYTPPAGVKVISRDRNASPAAGLYNICYINGFQVQPDEEGVWPADLILRDQNGRAIIDSDWDEMLLDISTDQKRTRIANIVGKWIEKCAEDGFDAVEIDNLDSFSRSGSRIKKDQAVAFMALLSPIAHKNRLAIAQKNSTELLKFKEKMGTDFAIAEECSRYDECADYVDSYQENVFFIEYRTKDFEKGCSEYGKTHSIILRDLLLRKPGSSKFVYDGC